MNWGKYALAGGLAVLAGVWCIAPLPAALTKTREAIPSLIFMFAVALLRDSAGGINSAVGALALLPVFYTALYGDRAQLYAVVIGMATLFMAQSLLVGPPAYPHTQYRAGLLFVTVSTIVGLTTQWLVAQARLQTADAQYREHMLEQIAEVIRGLSSSPRARQEVCDAARTISNASVAILFEPVDAASGRLRST
jgi:K+-sensing histidine kinase KdpD